MDLFSSQGNFSLFLPVFLIVVMYLMVYMPQKKKEKKMALMINSLQEGFEIVTIGGVVGKILNIKDNEITIETSIEKTQLKIMKWAVREIVEKAA